MRLIIAMLALLVFAAPARAADITVTTHADLVADDGQCSLREAVSAANADAAVGGCPAGSAVAADSVRLDLGLYLLSRPGAREDGNATGDLDVAGGDLVIAGRGPGTTISTAGIDRVLDVQAGPEVRVEALTVAFGTAPNGADSTGVPAPGADGESGGGIRSAGALTLVDAAVTYNRAGRGGAGADSGVGSAGGAGGSGGGISATGALTLIRTLVADNTAGAGGTGGFTLSTSPAGPGGPGGAGGGIAAGGPLSILSSRVVRNAAGDGATGRDSCSGGNGGSGAPGGGIAAPQVHLQASTVSDNRAGRGGDGGLPQSCGAGVAGSGAPGGSGGGIFAGGGSEITGTLLDGNAAGDGGRGANGLTAGSGGGGGSGGGLFLDGQGTLTHVTVTPGRAGLGGARGSGQISNGTPGANGTGAAAFAAATTHIARSILDGSCAGPLLDDGFNLAAEINGCPGSLRDPLLGPDGTPLAGSPAIDAAPAAGCPGEDPSGTSRPQGVSCDIGALEVPAAALTGIPASVAFAARPLGVATTRAIAVRNPGLPGVPFSVSVSGAADFRATESCPPVLLGGGTCVVTVRFVPSRPGARTARLTIGGHLIALSGAGIAPQSRPEPKCVVPKLKGKTLKAARRALTRAHCTLGKVTRRGRGRRGRIRSSKPKAGSVRASGAAVDVVVNRRRARPPR